jgi:hypothetical protein
MECTIARSRDAANLSAILAQSGVPCGGASCARGGYNDKTLTLRILMVCFPPADSYSKKTQEVITMKDVVDKCSTKGCAIDVGDH